MLKLTYLLIYVLFSFCKCHQNAGNNIFECHFLLVVVP